MLSGFVIRFFHDTRLILLPNTPVSVPVCKSRKDIRYRKNPECLACKKAEIIDFKVVKSRKKSKTTAPRIPERSPISVLTKPSRGSLY